MAGREAKRHDADVGEDEDRDHGQEQNDRCAEPPGSRHARLTLLNAPRVALLPLYGPVTVASHCAFMVAASAATSAPSCEAGREYLDIAAASSELWLSV